MRFSKTEIGFAVALAVVAVAAVLVFTGRLPAGGRADPVNAEQVALGERIYRDHCASCHGANLEGQPQWQVRKPDGRMPAPPHDQSGHTWHHPDDVLFRITKDGLAALLPGYESDMPAYAQVLTDEEIWAVLSFIKRSWPADIQARQADINRRSVQAR